MRLYNTRTRTVEAFQPLRDNVVRIYVCGLTPSAEAHVGHARSFVFFDVLRRYLAYRGYGVTYVQNVTDIDDRSIAAAREAGISWKEVVERYYASFKNSMRRLGVCEPDHEPRATNFVPQIIDMIGRLIQREHAYVVGDGVYFRVKSFSRYGAFSGRNVDDLLIGARIAPGEEKLDPLDFALWKFVKPGEPSWPSPWGDGRPGWHIECSAMTHALLGEPFDIHGGGYDLIFPHHENEIAQSEALLARPPMANVWMHGGLLTFDGKKMSKSLGNFEPLHALLDRHDAQAIRLLFLQTGYRKPMNFSEESLVGATEGLRKLFDTYDRLAIASSSQHPHDADVRLDAHRARFFAMLDDDMNTAGAVAELFKLVGVVQSEGEMGNAEDVVTFMRETLEILGIPPSARSSMPRHASVTLLDPDFLACLRVHLGEDLALTETDLTVRKGEYRFQLDRGDAKNVIDVLIHARDTLRQAKDFALADHVRIALAKAGITLTDGKEGTTWNVAG